MIQLIKNGTYKLIETKSMTKILYFDKNGVKKVYAWINAAAIGEILVS